MSRHRAETRTRPGGSRHRTALALALVAALGVGAGGAGTYAFWNDTANVTTGTLRAGTMDLRVDDNQASGLNTGWTKSTIAFAGRTPGEYEAYPLTLRNVGDPPGTYTLAVLRGSTWTYLNDAVVVQAYTGAPVEDTTYPVQDTCSGTAVGPERLVSTTAEFPLLTASRSLAAGGSETLCLRIGLATTAADGNQDKSGTLVFRAVLTQAS